MDECARAAGTHDVARQLGTSPSRAAGSVPVRLRDRHCLLARAYRLSERRGDVWWFAQLLRVHDALQDDDPGAAPRPGRVWSDGAHLVASQAAAERPSLMVTTDLRAHPAPPR